MVQVKQLTYDHVVFINRKGRRWEYVCVTCSQRGFTMSKHDTLALIREHNEYNYVYDHYLNKIARPERRLF